MENKEYHMHDKIPECQQSNNFCFIIKPASAEQNI